MTKERLTQFRSLEGRRVSLATRNGSRIDDSQLISAGSNSLWLFTNGADIFLPIDDVVEVWEVLCGVGLRSV